MADPGVVADWWWVVLTLIAAGAQTARNAMQKGLTGTLGTVGATQVRFLFGLPFAVLSLAAVLLVTGRGVAWPPPQYFGWIAVGALSQIAATALMLAAMRLRSFVVATAYVKTEAVQVALFAAIFLSETLPWLAVVAVVTATAGVLLMSWPRRPLPAASASSAAAPDSAAANGAANGAGAWWKPASLGLAAGALFAASAIGFKGAIVALEADSFVVAATVALVCGLLLQTVLLTAWQALRDRRVLVAIFAQWRPSLLAGFMGALASQMWFLAFAIAPTASVRTLGLVEVLFAQALSRHLFSQQSSRLELIGVTLVLAGALLLINA